MSEVMEEKEVTENGKTFQMVRHKYRFQDRDEVKIFSKTKNEK